MKRRLPPPATVIATIALLVALGGAGYAAVRLPANSVGTAQIKNAAVSTGKVRNNAITGAKVRNGTLTAADFAPGTLREGTPGPRGAQGERGERGAQGERGPQGERGAVGAEGPLGISALQRVTVDSDSDSDSPKSGTAYCPAGMTALSATYTVYGVDRRNIAVTDFIPEDGAQEAGWFYEAYEATATSNAWYVRVVLTCGIVADWVEN